MSGFQLFAVLTVAVAFIAFVHAVPQEAIAALLQYREQCIDVSGSDEGYRQTLVAIPQAKACILDHIDIIEIRLDVPLSESDEKRKDFFDKYCPKFNESVNCFDDIFEGIAKCTGEETEKIVPVFKDVAYGVVDLICENDGQFVFDAQKPEFVACIGQLRESVTDCKISNVTRSISLTQYGEEQCRDVENSKDCIKQKVDSCSTPAVYNIFEVLFNRIMKASNCHQYTKVVELYDNHIHGTSSND